MGIIVSLASGVIADKYSAESPRTFSNMCIASSLLAMPFYSLGVLTHDNVWVSMVGITGWYLGALFWSPQQTMIQESVAPEKLGEVLSGYQFYTIFAGCSATLILGTLINTFDINGNPEELGKLLAIFGLIGFTGSSIAWDIAGEKFKDKINK